MGILGRGAHLIYFLTERTEFSIKKKPKKNPVFIVGLDLLKSKTVNRNCLR